MPEATKVEPATTGTRAKEDADRSWTYRTRQWVDRVLPMDPLLPHRQPYYVGSWVYVFGVITIAALVWVVVSGVVLSFMGPQWWHGSGVGRFFNSLHFWSVQLFFVFMVLHLWGQFFMASWREGRAPTWMIGAIIFLFSILAAFTGYVAQQNLDSQWIAANAKDAVNASGAGGFFNVLNFGQMYGLHVMLVPVAVTFLVVVHVVQVRMHVVQVRMRGVVAPIDQPGEESA